MFSGCSNSRPDGVCVSDICSGSTGYTGHYIVICCYDAVTDEFEIRDPAGSRKREKITSWCLEQAHKSFGTDEDLLVGYRVWPSLVLVLIFNFPLVERWKHSAVLPAS